MKRRKPEPKNEARDEWKREQNQCMNPGCKATARNQLDYMACHEIVGGSDKPKAVSMPATWLFLCQRCHGMLGSRPNNQSLSRQLAVKKWADPENYDLVAVVKLYYPNCQQSFVEEIADAVAAEYALIVKDFA